MQKKSKRLLFFKCKDPQAVHLDNRTPIWQEACHAKQFGAVYFLKTGKKACPGRPEAPCVTCINETLRQRYSEEHAAHEAYETLAENAGTHRCMLLRIAEEECEHAQMILCILQTCL